MSDIQIWMALGASASFISLIIAVIIYMYSNGILGGTGESVIKTGVNDLISGLGSGSIDIVKQIGDALNAKNKACVDRYGSGKSYLDNIFADTTSCWMCKAGHPDRSIINGVSTDKACEGNIELIKAARIADKTITEEEASRMFTDPSGIVGICPLNSDRNAYPITSDTPCTGKSCSVLYGSESFPDGSPSVCYSCPSGSRNGNVSGSGRGCTRKCEDTFTEDLNGSCFKCPEGTSRTSIPITEIGACDKFGVANSGVAAEFGKPWIYNWTENGKLDVPLRFKESVTASAEYLGPIMEVPK